MFDFDNSVDIKMTRKKPLGHKSYGSIPHLPGSRQSRDDIGLSKEQSKICLSKTRDKHDHIVVLQKLDGSNCAIANIDGRLVPLTRGGLQAEFSRFETHRVFTKWFHKNKELFEFLEPGERVCGEWMGQAVGTLYELKHDPFVAFDIMREGHERLTFQEMADRVKHYLPIPQIISQGPPMSIDEAISLIDPSYHGAKEEVEGAVWRVERKGKVDFLTKYVRSCKIDGKYFPELTGKDSIWHWHYDENKVYKF